MHLSPRLPILRAPCVLVAALALNAAAQAGDAPRAALLPAYKSECSACHIAYPPALLPAASWQRVMSTLARHYGADASLDPATARELSAWLSANAGTAKRVREEPPQDRITLSAWFVRKHREVPTAAWARPAVKSAANCATCHTQAEQGDFNEHNVRIPR